jgi:hypothetical protein
VVLTSSFNLSVSARLRSVHFCIRTSRRLLTAVTACFIAVQREENTLPCKALHLSSIVSFCR